MEWSLNRNVSIIMLDLCAKPPNDYQYRRLERIMHKAGRAGVLIFCPVDDSAAKFKDERGPFIKLGGFGIASVGQELLWTGTSKVDFTVPDDLRFGNDVRGNSVSTAVAVGIASFILFCITNHLARRDSEPEELRSQSLIRMTRPEAMRLILRELVDQPDSKLITANQLFDMVEEDESFEIVTNVYKMCEGALKFNSIRL